MREDRLERVFCANTNKFYVFYFFLLLSIMLTSYPLHELGPGTSKREKPRIREGSSSVQLYFLTKSVLKSIWIWRLFFPLLTCHEFIFFCSWIKTSDFLLPSKCVLNRKCSSLPNFMLGMEGLGHYSVCWLAWRNCFLYVLVQHWPCIFPPVDKPILLRILYYSPHT